MTKALVITLPLCLPSGDEAQEVIDHEGDMEVDMSIEWLTSHLLERVFEGPELRASSSDVSQSFTLKFGGSRICCKVPQHALSETSGEVLSPDLLYLSMKLELEELEAFGVGEVIPEYEARKEARSSGRRSLNIPLGELSEETRPLPITTCGQGLRLYGRHNIGRRHLLPNDELGGIKSVVVALV